MNKFAIRRNCSAGILASVATVLSLAALLGAGTAAQAVELKAGYGLSHASHWGDATTAFADKLGELSGGKFTVAHFPDSQLGSERAMVEGLQIGTIDIVLTSTGPVGNFVPETQVFDLPFIFRDYDHARAVQDGPIGQELLGKFDQAGIVALAWGDAGFRHFTNNTRPVVTPADLAGIKHRTMENDAHILAFRTLSALPTPMAFTELYTSLQNGTLDGQENPISVTISGKLYEVQKHMTLTGHALTNALVLTSQPLWDSLSDEEKGWFREAAKAASAALRARVDSDDAAGVAFLREHGVEIVETVDREAFRAALEPAYENYRSQFGGELIERITATP
jgi:tripartite ATP-independent transporter DctP family solute receptor